MNLFKSTFSRYVENVFAQLDALGIEVEGYVEGRLKVSVPETTNIMVDGTNLAGDLLAEKLRIYMAEKGYRADFIDARVRHGDTKVVSSIPDGNLFGIGDAYLLKEAG